jgi:hypothetical protein
VPITKSWSDLGFDGQDNEANQTGIEWFNGLDDDQQQAMMGKAAWTAWQDGEFALADYPTTYQSSVYGEMVREKSLKELRAA